MSQLNMFIIFVLFFVFVADSTARQCYQCSGTEACKNPNKTTCTNDNYGCGSITVAQSPNQVKDCMSIDDDTGLPMYLQGCLQTNLRELGLTNATICGCMGKDLCNGVDDNKSVTNLLAMSAIFVFLFNLKL
ncbi:hypothetical protein M3Y97_01084000 [Aphelenchoides bicaudatus]|nr:hypothetical protein M3Y97_01084000 [Aphelenchoides bicaudatus]